MLDRVVDATPDELAPDQMNERGAARPQCRSCQGEPDQGVELPGGGAHNFINSKDLTSVASARRRPGAALIPVPQTAVLRPLSEAQPRCHRYGGEGGIRTHEGQTPPTP